MLGTWIRGLVFTAADVKSWISGLKSWGFLELLGSNFLIVNSDRMGCCIMLPMLNPGFSVSRFEVILNCLVQTELWLAQRFCFYCCRC